MCEDENVFTTLPYPVLNITDDCLKLLVLKLTYNISLRFSYYIKLDGLKMEIRYECNLNILNARIFPRDL